MKDSDWEISIKQYTGDLQKQDISTRVQIEDSLRKSLTLLEMTRRVIEPDYPLLAENIKTHLSNFKPK